jgi:mannose-6-phosphate isomerase-like protein (cupin superfamily)
MDPVSLDDAFDSFDDQWAPRLAATANGQAVKVAKVEGEFVWHSHADADEVFLVHEGTVTIQFRDREDATLEAGDLLVVPAGVEHRPVAEDEAMLVLFEPRETTNTGDAGGERTVDVQEL